MDHRLPLKQIVEAAIMASERPLSVERMMQLFEDSAVPLSDVRAALKEIATDCDARGYELKLVASGYRFQIKKEYGEWVGRLWKEKPTKYSRALLETLALIAYEQPLTRGDIEEVRGVAVSTNIMRTLLEREWVRVVGHRDGPGRPALYATTKDFLDYFNLRSLDDLPDLPAIRGLIEAREEIDFGEASVEVESGQATTDIDEARGKVITMQENIRNRPAAAPAADDANLLPESSTAMKVTPFNRDTRDTGKEP